jgi:hypothetical protein
VLGDVARIVKGAGTCADAAFVVSPAEAHALESAALRPCVRGRDVEAWGTFDPAAAPRCVVPYTAGGAPVPLTTVRARWPRALAHLMAGRPGVGAADVARFGRPQNLALHLGPAPRVVFPDVARAPRAMLVPGGHAGAGLGLRRLRPPRRWRRGPARGPAGAAASPHVGRWLDERAAPLRGGYRRMKTAIHWRRCRLPAEGPWLDAVIGAVRGRRARRRRGRAGLGLRLGVAARRRGYRSAVFTPATFHDCVQSARRFR